jgi:DNA ligase (NAD+)
MIFPTHCPDCNTELILSKTGIDLICTNVQGCHAQIVGRLSYFCQRNLGNIAGMSDKTLEKFISEFGIIDVADLYKLPWDKIQELEGFGNKSVENLKVSIEKSKQIADYKFLAGLGIEGVGPEVAKLICEIIR